jgi:hypothetical protein
MFLKIISPKNGEIICTFHSKTAIHAEKMTVALLFEEIRKKILNAVKMLN